MAHQFTRRHALSATLAWAGAAVSLPSSLRAAEFRSPNARPRLAAIGTGSRWSQKATGIDSSYGSAKEFVPFGDYVAVCDADSGRLKRAAGLAKDWCGGNAVSTRDYRELLERDDIDAVHISTPDHWHAKIAIEAMLAGKDVYCEKPMTLTIDQGKQICEVVRRTGKVFQVGTQQRSNMNFIRAVALVREGRLGRIVRATCHIGGAPVSPALPVAEPPKELDWNLWQGPVADVPFRYMAGPNGETKSWSRCHYEFRWWYEYSGGKLTDWGAHHIDCALWAMGLTDTGPVRVRPEKAVHPVEFRNGYPLSDNRYNTATEFELHCDFEGDVRLNIVSGGGNGILLEGTEGRIFVNRGRLTGSPVENLAADPLPEGAVEQAYKGTTPVSHFRNFFDCLNSRREPVSDVFSHHRALSVCHLAAIAARLNQTLEWDPEREQIVGNKAAAAFLSRDSRKGFETITG